MPLLRLLLDEVVDGVAQLGVLAGVRICVQQTLSECVLGETMLVLCARLNGARHEKVSLVHQSEINRRI